MKTFKTKKGTEIPLLDLKGKDYLQVPWRVLWFREEYPLGRIESEIIKETDKYVIYKATISVPDQNGQYLKLSDSIKREDYAHFADAHEKASTGAVGRALALCGFGTQFAPELSEEDRIADAPLEKKREKVSLANPPPPKFEEKEDMPDFESLPTSTGDKKMVGGKYNGELYSSILKDNPGYAVWANGLTSKGKAIQDFLNYAKSNGAI